MSPRWLQVKVELLEGGGVVCDPPPGRVFIVGGGHSFRQLAEAIDVAFARWDPGHLHEFELPDGRRLGYVDDEDPDSGWLGDDLFAVTGAVGPGEEFTYVFDLGEHWLHRCTVLDDGVDPVAEFGESPSAPAPIIGWGWIPDQYGRETPGD